MLRLSVFLGSMGLLCACLLAGTQAGGMEAGDDAFIAFRVAKNLALGHGPVFNPGGPPVEAASSFLFTATIAQGVRLGLTPLSTALAQNVLAVAFTLLTLLLFPRLRGGVLPGLVAAPVLASLTLTARNTLSGLETPLVGALLLAAVLLFEQADAERALGPWRRRILLGAAGLVLALLGMSRPEGPLYLLAVFLARAAGSLRKTPALAPPSLKDEACWLLVFIAVYGPYFAVRLHLFGTLLPNTFWAKDMFFPGLLAKLQQGALYLGVVSLSEPLLPAALCAGAYLLVAGPESRSGTLVALLVAQTLFMVASGGDWPHMFGHGRFLYPVLPLALCLLVRAGSHLWASGRRRLLVGLVVFLAGLTQVDALAWTRLPEHLPPHMHLPSPPRLTRQRLYLAFVKHLHERPFARWQEQATSALSEERYRLSFDAQAGLYLRRVFGPAAPIASIQAGQFAYFADMPFFDLFGLATPGVAAIRDDGPRLLRRMNQEGVRLVAFYRWGNDLHHGAVVDEGSLWRAGFGLRLVLRQGRFRAFVVFERGHPQTMDPRVVLRAPLDELPALVPPEQLIELR